MSKQYAKVIAKSVEQQIKVLNYVPVSLAENIKGKFAKEFTSSGNRIHTTPTGTGTSHLTDKDVDKITTKALKVPKLYRAYYLALLDTMSDVLTSPHISINSVTDGAPVSAHRQVELKTKGYGGPAESSFTLTSGVTTSPGGTWKPLSPLTLQIKRGVRYKSGRAKFYQQYWKHTGKLAAAFKTAKEQQKAKVGNLSNFVINKPDIKLLQKSEGAKSKLVTHRNKTCYALEVTMKIAIPSWNGPSYMDKIVTFPFMGIRGNANKNGPKSSFTLSEALGFSSGGSALDKIAIVEYNRPWLRRLSYMTGEQLRKQLNKLR